MHHYIQYYHSEGGSGQTPNPHPSNSNEINQSENPHPPPFSGEEDYPKIIIDQIFNRFGRPTTLITVVYKNGEPPKVTIKHETEYSFRFIWLLGEELLKCFFKLLVHYQFIRNVKWEEFRAHFMEGEEFDKIQWWGETTQLASIFGRLRGEELNALAFHKAKQVQLQKHFIDRCRKELDPHSLSVSLSKGVGNSDGDDLKEDGRRKSSESTKEKRRVEDAIINTLKKSING